MQTNSSLAVTEAIRIEMARQRVTQSGLADRLNVSRTWVHHRVSGKLSPTVDDLTRIADALEVPVAQLLKAAS